jgi:hypothetical protein
MVNALSRVLLLSIFCCGHLLVRSQIWQNHMVPFRPDPDPKQWPSYRTHVVDGFASFSFNDEKLISNAVLRIRNVYPGSRVLIFTHPGSRILDPKKATIERGEKIFCHTYFL